MQENILIVDDESDVLDLLRYNLQKAGFAVLTANNGVEGLQMSREFRPDAIVLDVMMPELDGLGFCKAIREDKEMAPTPVLMLTAKDQQRDKIKGLEVGVDDYMTKPFSPKELVLRIQAILRRSSIAKSNSVMEYGPFKLDKTTFEFQLNGDRVDLTTTEFKLLSLLLERRGRVLSREKLLHEVWGYRNPIDTRTVDTHMRRLRAKLEADADWIETIRGEGYRMKTS